MGHIMLDIETLGTSVDAAIISIGACKFDIETGKRFDAFQSNIDLGSGMEGRAVDADTLRWWMGQDHFARGSVINGTKSLPSVLNDLRYWIDPAENDWEVWGNGATFDISILEHAYRQYNIPIPWKYRDVRDVRTICRIADHIVDKKDIAFEGAKHTPLADAMYQAKYVSKMWRALRG